MRRFLTVLIAVAVGILPGAVAAPAADLATAGEGMRARLVDATLELDFDAAQATRLVAQARAEYAGISAQIETADPAAARGVRAALDAAQAAAARGEAAPLARAGAQAWTALLRGVTTGLEASVQAGDAQGAREWLAAREYRVASSLTRLNADATTAVEALASGRMSPADALTAVRSDVLDAYQARLLGALRDLADDRARGFAVLGAEHAALAQGYAALLRPAYAAQRGEAAARALDAQLAALPATLDAVNAALGDFRAAPLTAREVAARAAQVTRFLGLVPVEYARGVKTDGGRPIVTLAVEVNEARTFLSGARSALADLSPLLPPATGAPLTRAFGDLHAQLSPEGMARAVPSPDELRGRVQALQQQLRAAFPPAWQHQDASGDLDVVRAQLDAVVAAAQAGEWTAAETARLDAYALLESGTEARIAVFNPDLKARLEGLVWNGTAPSGLATLIHTRAPAREFQVTRAALQTTLADVAGVLGTEAAPGAVATNAGIIVFREGLEAVLILAALMGSLRRPAVRPLRRPMWLGAAGAMIGTAATWFVMQGALSLLGRYGEKLEAVVSVIAIGVLLLIMNWFYHQVYWTDRMASMQQHKHTLTHGAAHRAQWWGLAVLGFTSIYREGFETVLFLQSLVLQVGAVPVLGGAGAGLAAVCGVGVAVFRWQAKLPMKKLLIWTGVLIAAVLAVMVGNTVHTLQLVGWLPVHPLPVALPAGLGLWLGVHATWEGVLLQGASVVAVVGSFLAAEFLKERELAARRAGPTVST
ncbi:high-affinity iron transporter [Deinococcus metalli]|uniref:High-affinity iron transporter n=1 Tax=Deinococcus metalli TaxID=1141878 RepID=A0A7W8KC74_9DEIO|nr:FTR1 family protein [Deinococcus metalli]MBB5375512.1 high-affinity iron transporter [Deinococcus metalli]GHF28712.1 iron permease [Deinococcus metalli]